MTLDLSLGSLWAFGDRIIEIGGQDTISHVTARDTLTGQIVRAEISKLRALPSSNKCADPTRIPDKDWRHCLALAKDFDPYKTQASISRADLSRIAKSHGLSLRQVQRLRKKFNRNPQAGALARRKGGRPPGLNLLSVEVHRIINHTINKYYRRRERPTKADLIERVRSICRRLHYAQPSPNAIVRRIDQQSGYDCDRKRYGAKAAKQAWENRPGRLEADAPLALVQIDHTRVDVMVLSNDRQTVLGRPWITLAIDVNTRVVLGMYLAMHAPSSVSVSMCIEHLVLPKPEDREEPGTWPMYGKPRRILVDNGKDFCSFALMRGCEQHHIQLEWRPPKTPHYGAHIERLNGTLMRLCHLLPGTTFSNPKERGDYDSEGHAKLTLSELQAWLVEKICRYYHVRTHSGIGIPPKVAWERGFTDARGVMTSPPLVADPTNFRIDFLPFVLRKLRRTGIEFKSRYWHDDLLPLLNSREDVVVRYDPNDDRCVWVRMPDDTLVEVPAIAGPALGHPGRRQALDPETRAQLDREMDKHFERCDRIEESAAKKTRAARKKGGGIAKSSSDDANEAKQRPAAEESSDAVPSVPSHTTDAAATDSAAAADDHPQPYAAATTVATASSKPASSAPPKPLSHPVTVPFAVEDWF